MSLPSIHCLRFTIHPRRCPGGTFVIHLVESGFDVVLHSFARRCTAPIMTCFTFPLPMSMLERTIRRLMLIRSLSVFSPIPPIFSWHVRRSALESCGSFSFTLRRLFSCFCMGATSSPVTSFYFTAMITRPPPLTVSFASNDCQSMIAREIV